MNASLFCLQVLFGFPTIHKHQRNTLNKKIETDPDV